MRDPGSAPHRAPDPPVTAYEIARELHGILPFGARAGALARCPRLGEQVGSTPGDGEFVAATVVAAIDSFTDPVPLAHFAHTLAPALARRMLHVLLATRDLGWPGTDAPLSVRRVAAADLFFDDTQTVLSDDDWKGPNGVEFALLTAFADRLCRVPRRSGQSTPDDEFDEGHVRDTGAERLGQLHRVQPPRRI
jgi:hypothetical protein